LGKYSQISRLFHEISGHRKVLQLFSSNVNSGDEIIGFHGKSYNAFASITHQQSFGIHDEADQEDRRNDLAFLQSHPMITVEEPESFFMPDARPTDSSEDRKSFGTGFGNLSPDKHVCTFSSSKSVLNVQTAVSTPRENRLAKLKPPTGKRIVKDYSIGASTDAYEKEKVDFKETAQMSFGLRSSSKSSMVGESKNNRSSESKEISVIQNKAKAVPEAIYSINEIELDLDSEIEEELDEVPKEDVLDLKRNFPSGSFS